MRVIFAINLGQRAKIKKDSYKKVQIIYPFILLHRVATRHSDSCAEMLMYKHRRGRSNLSACREVSIQVFTGPDHDHGKLAAAST